VAETFAEITERLAAFILQQQMFFVATAPSSSGGHVNVSPKGLDTFRILDPTTIAYLDLTGSGIETVSHVRDNGRICIMFCAFEGSAQIVRLHGRGEVLEAGTPAFDELYPLFPHRDHARAVIRVAVKRVATSCGYAVPLYAYERQRDVLDKYWERRTGEVLAYREEKNRRSIDGLPGLTGEIAAPSRQAGERATSSPPSSS
jgi:hypothetical protein